MEKRFFRVIAVISLITIGCCFIPRLLGKMRAKLYKAKSRQDEIDFDNLGPEVVKKNNTVEDEEDDI